MNLVIFRAAASLTGKIYSAMPRPILVEVGALCSLAGPMSLTLLCRFLQVCTPGRVLACTRAAWPVVCQELV
jgi:hypothetical protein